MRRWGLALPIGRLLGAGMLGALTEAAGICLMATATWLLVTAAGQPSITALTVAIVTVRALAIGRGVLRYLERLAGHDAVLRIVTDVRARIFATLVDRPPIRHADALSRMVSDVDAVQDLVVRVALPIASAGLVALLAVIVTFAFASGAGGVLLAGLLVTAVAIPVLGARLVRRGASRLAPLRAAYAVSTVDLVHGAADLAAYGATQRYEARGAAQAAELSTVERHLARRGFALDALSSTITGITAAAVLYTAAQDGLSPVWAAVLAVGTLATGELTLGLLAATRKGAEILSPLARVTELLTPTRPARPGPRNSAGSEPSTPTRPADSRPRDRAGSTTPTGIGASACGVGGEMAGIRVVGASVEGRLRNVDLTIAPGGRIAVVGASGAGKSTLLYLIAGEITPDSGSVRGNGTPYSVATGLMADAHIFHASIRDNMLLAKPDATDDQLHAALRVAGLGDFSAYPLEVIVGEDGAELSGGQRQRLALARAVLAAPRVLLLDEPTEGLDPDQADRVLESVLADAGDRAVVLVTHRLAHVDRQHFDEVLVMTDGSVRSSDPTH